MSITIDSSTDRCKFDLTAPNGAPTGDYTCMAWFLATSFAGVDTTVFMFGSQTTGSTAIFVQPSSAGKLQVFALNAALTGSTTLLVNNWYHAALVGNTGTSQATTLYLNGNSEVSGTGGTTTYNAGRVEFGNTFAAEWLRGQVGVGRMWNAKLTQAEIQVEMGAAAAVRTANLWGDWPMKSAADTTDISGNARHLVGANLTDGNGPPFMPGLFNPFPPRPGALLTM